MDANYHRPLFTWNRRLGKDSTRHKKPTTDVYFFSCVKPTLSLFTIVNTKEGDTGSAEKLKIFVEERAFFLSFPDKVRDTIHSM